MGAVFEAQHEVVKRRFAIKFLRPDLAARRDMLTRFQHEAQAAGALENENVAAAVDFGVAADGVPYIVMEYLAGESLASLLGREGRLPLSRAADLVAQACRGMHAAHAAGIVHRDLKPHNLFVCRRDDETDLVKVLDFGVAKLHALEELQAATGTGTVLGTPSYMSPEQARGEKVLGPPTDVYALGAIVYELVAGRGPHPGDSHHAVLHHIATQPAVPLASVQPGLPHALVALVDQSLSPLPSARPSSAEVLGHALAAFARRSVWPACPSDETAGAHGESASPSPSGEGRLPAPEATGGTPPVAMPRAGTHRSWTCPSVFATLAVGVVAVLAGAFYRATTASPGHPGDRALAPNTRFFVPPPPTGAVQQIAALEKASAVRDAALLTAMEAVPRAVWFSSGSPQEVESAVRNVLVHAEREGSVPVLVAYNLPYRDCAQYSAGGALDSTAYATWIDAFARGLGNGRAVVLLEPDSLGIIPYNTASTGSAEWCRPTVTDDQGRTVPAPGASPEVRYAQIAHALDRIERLAPHAVVYLDATHAAWLPAGEAAYRLVNAGVERAQGFFVNAANFQTTARSIQYGTAISGCIAYATRAGGDRKTRASYASCPANVGNQGPMPRTHFVVDTSRNGRGPLEAACFAAAPFDQPPAVVDALDAANWCNPPGVGLGLRPTANTGKPLVDAYLWVKSPGTSDASCDIAGGGRAWDFTKYNPWALTGDAQKHFDPLWGMVDPAVGDWFPEHAIQLAQNAVPSFETASPPESRSGDHHTKSLAP
jgi:endoglucanase